MSTEIKENLVLDETKEKETKKNDLLEYAFCGSKEFFNYKLEDLKKIAEKEEWSSTGSVSCDRLYNYIVNTFSRCKAQDKILTSEDGNFSVFNTGLLTENSEEIFGIFEVNNSNKNEKWKFKSFVKESDRIITNNFERNPDLATYTENPNDFYFDPTKDVIFNADHILDDNWERYPESLKRCGKQTVCSLVRDAFEIAKKKIQRNNRLVVPQFYKNQIMYLMPISIPIGDNDKIMLALAIEKTSRNKYRANTIFTIEMAYPKARLIMKPESNWLIVQKKEVLE